MLDTEEKIHSLEDNHSHESNTAVNGILLGSKSLMSDEGITKSLNIVSLPEPIEWQMLVNKYGEAGVEFEGEIVSDAGYDFTEAQYPIPEIEEDDETEYRPIGSRSKRCQSSRSYQVSSKTPEGKRNKDMGFIPGSASQFKCRLCQHIAKNTSALLKHQQISHIRPYLCTFSFAGCPSTFGSKNEWKRHVASQHLRLQHWLCDIGKCSESKVNASQTSLSDPSSHPKIGGYKFCRKDLFVQHLRRMHTPSIVARTRKKSPEWEERLKNLQVSCLRVRRTPPEKTRCPVRACAQIFEGPTSWDDRMEHVGRHLERASATSDGLAINDIVEPESDDLMIAWALAEGILKRSSSGEYRLFKDSGAPTDEDSDVNSSTSGREKDQGPTEFGIILEWGVQLKTPNEEKSVTIQQSTTSHGLPNSIENPPMEVPAVNHHLTNSTSGNGVWALYEGSVALYRQMLPILVAKFSGTEIPSILQENFQRLAMWGEGLDSEILQSISEPRYELRDTLLDLTSNLATVLTMELHPMIKPSEVSARMVKELEYRINFEGFIGLEEEVEDLEDEGGEELRSPNLSITSRIASVTAKLKLYVGLLMQLLPSMDKTMTRMEKDTLTVSIT